MQSLGALWPIIIVVIVCYLFMFLPESKRRKKYNTMLSNLKVNDEILTKGGIIGKVTNIQEKEITIQTGPDRVKLKLSKSGILSVLSSRDSQEVSQKEDK
ncbi:MAG: preprotein translocase subunit YajC [Clostridium sp.]|uniref:preprotein translocase subunit YajC n=1 Tax=Clostridium sp. TaxID=1506 RepID=UPI0025C49A9F|nr:preprotein translocase subunit YajC [Clostridium sp.]MCH3962885.1 preprotein translocase subunit YajC [Clostridium sp.]MCI1715700.1 preprotein translocase subunit YajC [Clostridium sp.]MCI1800095.1 preprotein translocase subunit YajC [Clostridium sp.]MCI1814009.1 preprotein translocase subunit YajC [Clostridium sp.]MCI1870907.1 preprotein translocase subunit YajC [Clostridium sp.]